VAFVTIAEFRPPDALHDLDAWKLRNADALALIPPEDVLFDIGRAEDGDFARVRVQIGERA
jgi:hypothetical protein